MVQLGDLSYNEFLTTYWQKKPIVIRNALPEFNNPLSADELAGLALEEEIESRLIWETPGIKPYWHLKRGPFAEQDFAKMQQTHWTLLVQGVDRFIPEVESLLDFFSFIPSWRVDDIMISYATLFGSVGPHYDNYDVFLYQAKGQRKWSLTSKQCNVENHLPNIDLRIMEHFNIEEEYILDEGDMLYLPPHIGHHGVSLSAECMTYSFGYRSYQHIELFDSYAEYLAYQPIDPKLYQDPNWVDIKGPGEIPQQAWQNARILLQQLLDDENHFKKWFGCFVTRLDQQAESLLLMPIKRASEKNFLKQLTKHAGLTHNAVCRFAYQETVDLLLFVNGEAWPVDGVDKGLVKLIANLRFISLNQLENYLHKKINQDFLFELWRNQWLVFAS